MEWSEIWLGDLGFTVGTLVLEQDEHPWATVIIVAYGWFINHIL